MRFKQSFVVLALLVSVACAGNKANLTPATAAKAEKDAVTLVRDMSAEMLTAYKAGQVSSTISDPFFNAIDTKVLPVARRAKTAIQAWHLATGAAKVQSGEELKTLLLELEREVQDVVKTQLPPGIAQSIANIAQDIYDSIAKVRAELVAVRSAAASFNLVEVC